MPDRTADIVVAGLTFIAVLMGGLILVAVFA